MLQSRPSDVAQQQPTTLLAAEELSHESDCPIHMCPTDGSSANYYFAAGAGQESCEKVVVAVSAASQHHKPTQIDFSLWSFLPLYKPRS
jgi:hypothetical protein